MSDAIRIEVVFGVPETQMLVELSVPADATVADAIRLSKLCAAFPEHQFSELSTGIWGRPVAREQRLKNGDRVEIYRELEVDPMEARRLRASEPTPGPCESH
jgi:hypothetical protein